MTEKTIRREDARLLTGQGRTPPTGILRTAYAFFLRSDREHADIVSIDAKGSTCADRAL